MPSGTMDKLDEIMAWKRREIAPRVRPVSLDELAALNARLPAPPSFAAALRRADGKTAVIAEIKRRSPSAGAIAGNVSAPAQARRYQPAASAMSVLTDRKYFGGTLDDLRAVAAALRESGGGGGGGGGGGDGGDSGAPRPPLIRKDFMVHPVQVAEAREAGASAILIIVRALDDAEIEALHDAARAAGLDALFEIHHEDELARAVRHGARIIGVNNRDLSVFKTDLAFSERLIPQFPRDVVAVSESGIFTGADAARVRAAGAHAVLVGEALMRAADPAALIRELNG
ncbi:MAG: indole-3-glycerol phosphate synthase TrpC [Opitutaceae bacterium]|jgi:indole-3-glycerol phosphate synthase|nr:indole-3-glycerol phosphate synthase TrpC [Opitutaceae bacterium]